MKIATWNINGVRARIDTLKTWLEQAQPDIVCLQEIKSVNEAFPAEEIEGLGYNLAVYGEKGFNGVAILSKPRLEDVQRGLPGNADDSQARYIEATVTPGERSVRIASIYLPNGNPVGTDKFAYKLRWMERLRVHALELLAAERPTVLAGDFNVIPADEDVFSVRAMEHDALMQPESRAAFRRIVHQGWTDALRALHPGEPMYSFWDYTAGAWQRDAGFRIDHLLCDPIAADRLRGAGVDRWARGEEKASDHAPTWVELA